VRAGNDGRLSTQRSGRLRFVAAHGAVDADR
jgi:hypothetical protein